MRIGVAIDAACDVPQDFLERNGIAVMPITVKVDGQKFKDDRDPIEIQRFRDQKLGSKSHSGETEPSSVEDVQNLFLDRLVKDYDCVVCLTIMATRSPIHDNVIKASFAILKNYRPIREAAGITGPFLMRVVDTRNIFAGSGPVVAEAVRMIQAGRSPAEVRERVVAGTFTLDEAFQVAAGYLTTAELEKLSAAMGRFEATLRRWRQTHYSLAVRMLGDQRPGTGATEGTPYLNAVRTIPVFRSVEHAEEEIDLESA